MALRIIGVIVLIVIYVATKLLHADWIVYALFAALIAGAIVDYYWLGGKFIGGTYKDGKK